jgi:homocysteine S-methyltransferase
MGNACHHFQRAVNDRVLLLDGATGTELTRRGVPTPLPLWSASALLEHPDVVRSIHADYAKSGADIIVANTFRSNVRALAAAGLLDQGEALNRIAIELAREGAAGGKRAVSDELGGRASAHQSTASNHQRARAFIAASVAPVEDCYEPDQVPDEATLADEHSRMMTWLKTADPDLIWIETMNTIREARAAAAAAKEHALPFVVSFVVREEGNLLSGEPLEEALAAVEPLGPLALGLNCIPPEGVTRNLPRLRAATALPLVAYAHIGNPEPIQGWSFSESVTPSHYCEHAARWLDLGARIVGGCCGTTPKHIAALREMLDRGR